MACAAETREHLGLARQPRPRDGPRGLHLPRGWHPVPHEPRARLSPWGYKHRVHVLLTCPPPGALSAPSLPWGRPFSLGPAVPAGMHPWVPEVPAPPQHGVGIAALGVSSPATKPGGWEANCLVGPAAHRPPATPGEPRKTQAPRGLVQLPLLRTVGASQSEHLGARSSGGHARAETPRAAGVQGSLQANPGLQSFSGTEGSASSQLPVLLKQLWQEPPHQAPWRTTRESGYWAAPAGTAEHPQPRARPVTGPDGEHRHLVDSAGTACPPAHRQAGLLLGRDPKLGPHT